jgi:branched-chain amino acid aminotransferase
MADNFGAFVWHNGKFIRWEDAHIHVMSHVVHYGSSVFEGIRVYKTHLGSAVFRLHDHIRRLIESAQIYRMHVDYSLEDLCQAAIDTVKKNKFTTCYLRPVIFRGFGSFGVSAFENPLETYIAAWEWGAYLGPEALQQGVDVCFSSWNRSAPNTLPALAKCAANYMNSQLIKMEALVNGYTEGIALDKNGYVSEGSGENIFAVRDGIIYTPPISAAILTGITRNSVIYLCKDLGYELREMMLPREMLYIADEVFFTGTAAEITPIRSIDKIKIGSGLRGKITKHLQEEFFNIFKGTRPVPENWLAVVK